MDWNKYPEQMTVSQVRELLNLKSAQNISNRCKRGEYPAVKVGGTWRIDRDKLRALLASKPQHQSSLAEKLGGIELALSTLATVHRDDQEMSKLLRLAHATTLAAYEEARERSK